MKVKVLEEFYDRENNLETRKLDEVFEVDEERAEKLINLGYVAEVPETKTDIKKTAGK